MTKENIEKEWSKFNKIFWLAFIGFCIGFSSAIPMPASLVVGLSSVLLLCYSLGKYGHYFSGQKKDRLIGVLGTGLPVAWVSILIGYYLVKSNKEKALKSID